MSMRLKAIIVLILFAAILYLPFSVYAGSGHIFDGSPSPISVSAAAEQYSAIMDQYAANLPKPLLPNGAVDLNYMRNHMNILKQEGQSTKQCASCHADRANFCDKCHNYVGINPKIDY